MKNFQKIKTKVIYTTISTNKNQIHPPKENQKLIKEKYVRTQIQIIQELLSYLLKIYEYIHAVLQYI